MTTTPEGLPAWLQNPPTTVPVPAAVIRDAVRRTTRRDPDDTQDAT